VESCDRTEVLERTEGEGAVSQYCIISVVRAISLQGTGTCFNPVFVRRQTVDRPSSQAGRDSRYV